MAADKDKWASASRDKVTFPHPEAGAWLRVKPDVATSPVVERLAAHPDAKTLAADVYLLAKELVFDDRVLSDALTVVGDIFHHGGGARPGSAR